MILGTRSVYDEVALDWAEQTGDRAEVGTFADAVQVGDLVFNSVPGDRALAALGLAGAYSLAGKVLIDMSGPVGPHCPLPSAQESVAEQIQLVYPEARVVKALHIADHEQAAGAGIDGEHPLLICGDDVEAKREIRSLFRLWFGWTRVIDLGGVRAARGLQSWSVVRAQLEELLAVA